MRAGERAGVIRVAQGVEAKVGVGRGSTGTQNIDKRGAALFLLKKMLVGPHAGPSKANPTA